ncbi:proline dehydrogenase 1, mitochondrial-like [Uranotaenia lowii]|uniref:proline dehydrogenase 1, mitochondrial-like n=1 Tax=Uranotaenia lowii TaxID=190385 RepID=UPI0024785A52|nr:proline dehydrogenase 1, mitochondrial-like [Uranotaenia lowii]
MSILQASKIGQFISFKNLRPLLHQTRCWAKASNDDNKSPAQPVAREKRSKELDLTFNNPEEAFRSKTSAELVRAYAVYTLCSVNFIVNHNMMLMKLCRKLLGDTIFTKLMKASFYGHFVAGEDQVAIGPAIARMKQFGVGSILDYSVEEDLSEEEGQKRGREGFSTDGKIVADELKDLPQYTVDKISLDRRYKVSSARVYFYEDERACDRNMEIFLQCLDTVKKTSPGSGIMAIKMTGLGKPNLLLQLSAVITRARNYMTELGGGSGNVLMHQKTVKDLKRYLKGAADQAEIKSFLKQMTINKGRVVHLFPWSGIIDEKYELSKTFRVPDPTTGQMRRLVSQIPPEEEEKFRNMIRRLNTIIKTAKEANVRVMVDAEQTYFQPIISRITVEMMRKYNTEKPIVLNTYQCYLKEAFREVSADLEQAQHQNFYFGCKFVRGAYMDQERERAKTLNYEDPINPDYEATTEMYFKNIREAFSRIKALKESGKDPRRISITVASHDEDTVRFAIQEMKKNGISRKDNVVSFGQLYGMCDYITFPLGQAGYPVFKYVPYGPVTEVLPYLSRRAAENRGVLKKIKKEKSLLLTEIRRRRSSGQWSYVPKA